MFGHGDATDPVVLFFICFPGLIVIVRKCNVCILTVAKSRTQTLFPIVARWCWALHGYGRSLDIIGFASGLHALHEDELYFMLGSLPVL